VYASFFLTRDWLSGWFPALIGLLAIILIGNWKVGLPLMALGGLFVLLNLPTVSGLVSGGDNTYSLMTRQKAWEILIEIIKVNPILGLGPSNYYWYTALFNILGYYVTFNSHNNYVDIIAQTGFLGMACFLFFFTQIGLTIWRLLPRVPQGFPRAYLLGALGGLVGTLAAGVFGDWIIPFVYNIGFAGFRSSVLCWLFLGGVTAIQNGAVLNRGELP
jgi:O-antigen ligase